MNIPTKKLKMGLELPVYGFGTWLMGGRMEHDVANDDEADISGIRSALDTGITHIDTAELYADGYTEILIGKAIQSYNRSKIFLVSKVQSKNLKYNDIINSCKKSLERLQTNYLDMYLLHFYNPEIPLKESIQALDKLVEEGLVKYIGVCNFNKEHLAEAQSYTKNKIVCNQVHYNLIFREPERKELLKYCQENDIFISAWRPMQYGELSKNVPPVLKEICDKYKKTPSQVALNWLITQPYVITLSKTRSMEHLNENLGALDWQMDEEDIEHLRNEYPEQQDVSNTVPLG